MGLEGKPSLCVKLAGKPSRVSPACVLSWQANQSVGLEGVKTNKSTVCVQKLVKGKFC